MIYKKIFAALLSSVIAMSALTLSVGSLQADAATFSQINQSSVFVKQNTSVTCTLASNVMMLRRTAMMRGDSDWASITESAARSTLWYEDVGMYHNYSYKNINVGYAYVNGDVRTTLINALKEHPEGIVAYDWSYPHAILLTDYSNGVFYCSDPARSVESGRINATNALVSVDSIDSYWYVISPDVKLTSNTSSTQSDTSSSDSKETWRITSDDGVNMRSGAGTSYSTVGGVPYNATVTVAKKTTSGGYTWGYTTYRSQSGWIALDYARKISTSSKPTANTSISASSVSIGDSVTLKISATGGTTPYQYAYYYRMNANDSWKTIKGPSSSTSVTYKPSKVGTYEIAIKVIDANNQADRQYHQLTVKNALKSKSSMSTSTINLGKSVTLKCQGLYGTPDYEYAYYYREKSANTWTTIKSYSSASSAILTPKKPGTYEVAIKARDKVGRVSKQYYTLTVNPTLQANSSVSAKSIKLGGTVTLKIQGEYGKTPYQYAYYYRLTSSDKWTTLKSYSSTSSVAFKPTKAGKYEIAVKVMDANGKVAKNYYDLTVSQ